MSFDSTTEEEQGSFIWEIQNYGTGDQGELYVSDDYETDNVVWSLMLRKGRRVTKSGKENRVVYTVSGFREEREPIRVKIRFLVIAAANVTTLVTEEVFETSGGVLVYEAVFGREPLPNEYLVNDVLTLRFDVAFSKIIHKSSVEAMQSDIISYLSEQVSGHVVLRVEEEEFRVHKILLSARSPFFRDKFEKVMNETLTDPIIIKDVSAVVFKLMVSYMNGEELDEPSTGMCIGLYLAAENYWMKDLKALCVSVLEKNLSTDNVCEVVLMADHHHELELRASCKSYISSHAAEVFCSKGWEELLTKDRTLASNMSAGVKRKH